MATSGYPACYRPLPPGPDNIRLLRLFPSKDERAPICCQLLDYPLRGFGNRGHQYECLSYCWGSSEKPCSIDIDGVSLPITESLNDALLQLRDHTLDRHLWVDAVCINQEDIPEKEEQIQMMAKIYSQARQVVVWLGPEADDSDHAVELIRLAGAGKITRLSGVKSSGDYTDQSSVESSSDYSDAPGVESIDDHRNRSAVTALLLRPWFRRIWVLQEVAAAKHVHMMCGTAEIAGYSLCLGVNTLKGLFKAQPVMKTLIYSVSRLIRGGFFRSNTDMVATNRSSLNIYPLGELLDMYHTHQASLEHDKIYALLAMCSDDVHKADIIPNYDIPWEKLLQIVCKYILSEHVVVQTWLGATLSIVKGKGIIAGYLSRVTLPTITDEKQDVTLTFVVAQEHKRAVLAITASWSLQASAHPVHEGDLVCHFEGSSKLSIIRPYENQFLLIAIAATPPEVNKIMHSTSSFRKRDITWSDVLCLVDTVYVDLILVWDWMWKNDTEQNVDGRHMIPLWMSEDNKEQQVEEYHVPFDNHKLQERLQAEKGCYEMGVLAAMRMIVRDDSDKSLFPLRRKTLARLLHCNQAITVTEDLLLDIIQKMDAPNGLLEILFATRPKESILAATSESILVAAASSMHCKLIISVFLDHLSGSIHITEPVWLALLSNRRSISRLVSWILRVQGRIRVPITEAMVTVAAGNPRKSVKLLSILFAQNEMDGIDSRALITEVVFKAAEENTGSLYMGAEETAKYRKTVWEFLRNKQAQYASKDTPP